MGTFSLSHWLIVLLVVLIIFGAGRLPKTMGDLAKSIRAFRAGMREENADATPAVQGPAAGRTDSGAGQGRAAAPTGRVGEPPTR